MTNLLKATKAILFVIMILFLIWIFISFIEIGIFNLSNTHEYFDFNFFKLIFEKWNEFLKSVLLGLQYTPAFKMINDLQVKN